MLDSFRKRDAKSAYPRQSAYSEMQAALSPDAKAGDVKIADIKTAEVKTDDRPVDLKSTATVAETHSAQQQEKPMAQENVSKLIVGPDIKLKGAEITDCDTLVVEGRVEASMDSRVIQIAEHGVFVGKVDIDVAEIRGRFEGELVARKQLVIHSTGHVSGKIRYGKITVQEGGELLGDVAALATNGAAKHEITPKAAQASNTSEFKADTAAVGALFKAANQR
jgi:cytoskeletal protein CcmA (bactofilin family)